MAYDPPNWVRQFDGELDDPSPYTYGAGEPDASWRPFSAGSKWNTPIPGSPTVASDSAAVITWLLTLNSGNPADQYIGVAENDPTDDYGWPYYFTAAGDPTLRIKIATNTNDPSVIYSSGAGTNTGTRLIAGEIQNRLIRFPTVATPNGGSDESLVIISANYSYEMWQGALWTPGEGRYGIGYGGIFPLDGDGTSTDGHSHTAGGVSGLAGLIRLCELEAGLIDHALAVTAKWVRANTVVAPCIGCATKDPAVTAGDANDLVRPVTGSRLQLNYTEAEIDALGHPTWKTAILQAMREYGAIIRDTGGQSWTVITESSQMDISQSQPDRWRVFAAAQGWALSGGAGSPYVMPLSAGVDWTKLRIVEV